MGTYNKIFNTKTFHVLQNPRTYLWCVRIDYKKENIIEVESKEEAVEKAIEFFRLDKSEKKKIIVHGGDRATYRCWLDIRAYVRKNMKEDVSIYLCEEWKCFTGFLKDMGERPPNARLARHNNNHGYCKENCYWKMTVVKDKIVKELKNK